MARVFKRKDRLSAMSEINVTSLLDLVFCLLIIFMITTPLLEQTIKVNLPSQARNPGAAQDPKAKYVAVSVDKAGTYYYEKNAVSLDELRADLKKLAEMPDPPIVAVRGDSEVTHGKVVQVYTIMQEVGLTKLGIETQVN